MMGYTREWPEPNDPNDIKYADAVHDRIFVIDFVRQFGDYDALVGMLDQWSLQDFFEDLLSILEGGDVDWWGTDEPELIPVDVFCQKWATILAEENNTGPTEQGELYSYIYDLSEEINGLFIEHGLYHNGWLHLKYESYRDGKLSFRGDVTMTEKEVLGIDYEKYTITH